MFCLRVHLFLFPLVFGAVLGTNDNLVKLEPITAEDHNNCTSVRVVKLGIHAVYDTSFAWSRERKKAAENITEYLHLMVGTTAKQHFEMIPCTNISLVLIGASALENESSVLQLSKGKNLEIDDTLKTFNEYSRHRRVKFGNPDVTILLTDLYIVNTTKACKEAYKKSFNDEYENNKRKAYCVHISGGAYYKGMCGNNSVAIVKADGGVFEEQTALAKVISTLFGVSFDILRTEDHCGDRELHLMARASAAVTYPYLSRCGENELIDFIDCASSTTSVCWNDTPVAAVTSEFETPYEFFQKYDFCSRYQYGHYKCPENESIPNEFPFDQECTEVCCKKGINGPVTDAFTTPYGKRCSNGTGMCYWYTCIE